LDATEFAKILSVLSPRSHTMTLDFGGNYQSGWAVGTLKLDWSNANGQQITDNAQKAVAAARDNWDKTMVELPEEFSQAPGKFTDGELTTENIKRLITTNPALSGKTLIKMHIDPYFIETNAGDWTISKNDVGIPTWKVANHPIAIITKGTDGWCYYAVNVHVGKEYSGAGTYGKAQISNDINFTRISCDKVK
jgi:hypothetical protein